MKSRCACPSCNTILAFDRDKVSTVKCPKCAYQGNVADFKEIPMKDIQCPHCSATLKVKENAADSEIICPKCQRSIIPPKEEDVATEGPGILANKNKLYCPGKLELMKDDGQWSSSEKIVTLIRGMNTLGRKAASSRSAIQLPTTDPYISKNHAKIEVIMASDATFIHRLSDTGSTNGTFHNDDRLEPDEQINLTPGDMIRFGHTTFKFIG